LAQVWAQAVFLMTQQFVECDKRHRCVAQCMVGFTMEPRTEEGGFFASAIGDALMPVFAFFLARSRDRSTDLKSTFRCLAVCRAWSQIVQSPVLWSCVRVSIYGENGCDDIGRSVALDAKNLATFAPLLRHSHNLDFFFSRWSDELLSTVLTVAQQAGSNLRVLSLRSIRFLQLPPTAVVLGDSCKGLMEFSLERSRGGDASELAVLEGLFAKWHMLEKLSLRFAPFAESTVRFLSNLRELSLTTDAQQCSPEAVEALGACSNLRQLTFVAAHFICSHVSFFGTALEGVLRRCSLLEVLALGKLSIDDALLAQICQNAASRLNRLRLESCKWPRVSPASFSGLGELYDLEFSNCKHVTDEELYALSAGPRRCLRRLAVRNVHGTDVSDAGLFAIASSFTEIEDLCVTGDANGGNAVTNQFLESLIDSKVIPCLSKLNLRGFSGLRLDVVERIRLARPLLSLQWAELRLH